MAELLSIEQPRSTRLSALGSSLSKTLTLMLKIGGAKHLFTQPLNSTALKLQGSYSEMEPGNFADPTARNAGTCLKLFKNKISRTGPTLIESGENEKSRNKKSRKKRSV